MTSFGYTLMTEQSGPRALVGDAVAAERAGFDFEVISDHYTPWLASMGHSPYAWATLGAVSQVTDRVELMTYVTCPTMRYQPAVVAQKAATVGLLSGGRFTLGLGAGENLNEHIVGQRWPAVGERHEMFVEALQIIGQLLDGGLVSFAGKHFRTESARLWDLPEHRIPTAAAVSGPASINAVSSLVDHLIAVEPDAELLTTWDHARGDRGSGRKIGQVPICWDADRDAAIARAHDQFRWFAGGWAVNADLPTPAGFAGATKFVTPDDVTSAIPCGNDVDAVVKAVSAFSTAGFTDIALVQVGGEHQANFLREAERTILPALRAEAS